MYCHCYCISWSSILVTGIARCFTFGGSRNRVLHDPNIQPRSDLSKEKYMKKDEQTTVNHFHEKLLKLKDLMKTKVQLLRQGWYYMFLTQWFPHLQLHASCILCFINTWSINFFLVNAKFLTKREENFIMFHWFQAGQKRAERRHKFMEEFLVEFYEEWDGRAWMR